MPANQTENSESMVTIPLKEYEAMKAKIEKLETEVQALDSSLMKIYRPIMKSNFAKDQNKTKKILSQLIDGKFEFDVGFLEECDGVWLCVSYKIDNYYLM